MALAAKNQPSPAYLSSMVTFFLGALVAFGACSDEVGADACDAAGSDRSCTCPNGVGSRQICRADLTWGACFCYQPGCGNGEVDPGEACDGGPGCNADCTQGAVADPGVGGMPNPTTTSDMATTTSNMTTTGMMNTTAGGMNGSGGSGGAGGNRQ